MDDDDGLERLDTNGGGLWRLRCLLGISYMMLMGLVRRAISRFGLPTQRHCDLDYRHQLHTHEVFISLQGAFQRGTDGLKLGGGRQESGHTAEMTQSFIPTAHPKWQDIPSSITVMACQGPRHKPLY